MGIKEALATFEEPGHYYLTYKDDRFATPLLVNVQKMTTGGSKSKLYIVPVGKSVYDLTAKELISVHRLNWLGLLDVKKIENAYKTTQTILVQQNQDKVTL